MATMRCMRSNDSTTPPEYGITAPVLLVPLPRATMATRCSRHSRTKACTCSRLTGNATPSAGAPRFELSLP